MAWRSILGKKGRSILTMLGIIIGIAAVMTIVSAMNGYTEKTMEQYKAMGSNKVQVYISCWIYDDEGNNLAPDYFPDLYDYCNSMGDLVVGTTPQAYCNANVVYGTKNSNNMSWEYDDNGNYISSPPQIYYASDQYSICNNLTIAQGRDMTRLDMERYNQVCFLGAQAAKTFFGTANPVGKQMQFNGQKFDVMGVYAPRLDNSSGPEATRIDNIILLPYTARRMLGGDPPQEFIVQVRNSEDIAEVCSRLRGFLKGLVNENNGYSDVYSDQEWQQSMNEQMGMISLVLGGIAAISLLVGGIGIMNIMLVTVTERTREIGIRRAIGAQRSSIITQFLMEAAMLCGIGGIIGIGFGTLGSLALGKLMFQMTTYPAVWITVCAFSLSVALGIIFGIYPAVKAANLQPVEALRAE